MSAAPTHEELVAYALGKLSPAEIESMAARLEQFPECLAELQTIIVAADSLVETVRQAAPAKRYAGEPELRQVVQKVTGMIAEHETIDISNRQDATKIRTDHPSLAMPAPQQLRDYRLLDKLGEGGMGAVYKAVHERLEKTVAIKILPAARMSDPQVVGRFHREMKAVGRLDHPNIIRATDAGEEQGTHFLVMEYVAGQDVAKLVDGQGPLSPANACEIVRQAALGLQSAHEHGLVHRDIKPSNMLLTEEGVVKLLDLGLARLHEEGAATMGSELTSDGQLMGTVDYMAPEQASDTRTADIRADIYSLGCSMYKLLTGKPPFKGEQFETPVQKIMAHAVSAPPPLDGLRGDLPPELSPIVARMLAKNRDQRFATPKELAQALTPLCAGADLAAVAGGKKATDSPLPPAKSPASAVRSPSPGGRIAAAASAKPVLAEQPPVSNTRRRIALLAAAAVVLVAAAFIVRVATDKGELVITSTDDQVEITVRRSGQKAGEDLELSKGDKHVTVRSGEVEVVIRGDNADRYAVSPNLVTLARGETKVVKIERKPPGAGTDPSTVAIRPDKVPSVTPGVPSTTPSNPETLPDKAQPFLITRAAGGKPVESGTLRRAVELAQSGDTIEIHGNGPFRSDELTVRVKKLMIQAAPGYRPVLVATQVALFHVADCELSVVGCDFRSPHIVIGGFFIGTGPAWEFRHCRFLSQNIQAVHYGGTRLTLRDCLVHSNHWSGFLLNSPRLDWTLENCILRWEAFHALFQPPVDADWRVVLKHNTIITEGTLVGSLADSVRLRVQASGNIFHLNEINGNGTTPGDAASWKGKFEWQGDHNLFVGNRVNGLIWSVDKKGKPIHQGLAGWNAVWGHEEEGSQEAFPIFPQWRAMHAVEQDDVDGLRDRLRAVVDSRRSRAGENGAELGPNWDLTGPGQAYVRALEAAGRPVDEKRLRPPVADGQPFVVLRSPKDGAQPALSDAEEVSAHDDLGRAIAAADQDGDIVEIRTDDSIAAPVINGPPNPRRLLIRAAPGYLPVIDGPAAWDGPNMINLTLSLEGLHFRGSLHPDRLARLANCSFAANLSTNPYANFNSIGSVDSGFRTPADQPAEIVNCLMTGLVAVELTAGSRLRVTNSAVGPAYLSERLEAPDEQRVELDHCLCWSPATWAGTPWNFSSAPAQGTMPHGATRVVSRHTLFESPMQFAGLAGPALRWSGFEGDHNLYATGEQAWFVAYGQGPDWPLVTSLRDWQKLWNSDADSRTTDPLVYDPEQWRLLPGTPGHKMCADGSDCGADVDRILRPTAKASENQRR